MKTQHYLTKVGNLSLSVPACVINETIENGAQNWENNRENLEKIDWDGLPPSALKLELKTRNIELKVKDIPLKGDENEQKEIAKENKSNIYYAAKNLVLWIACKDIVEKIAKEKEMEETVELEALHGIKHEPLITPSEKLFVTEVEENKAVPRYEGDTADEKLKKALKVRKMVITKAEIAAQKGGVFSQKAQKKEKVEKIAKVKQEKMEKIPTPAKEKRKTALALLVNPDENIDWGSI